MIHQTDCWTEQTHRTIVEEASQNLWRFLQKNATEHHPQQELFLTLSQLTEQDLQKLSAVHILLSPETEEFINVVAPAILNHLSKGSVQNHEQVRGAVKGRIDWGKTYTTRAALGGDPSVFVVGSRSNVFDLHQNRVLLYLLHQIYELTTKLRNTDWDPDRIDSTQGRKWGDRLGCLAYRTSWLLRNPYLPRIEKVQSITERQLELTERVRGQWYAQLANYGRLYLKSYSDPVGFLQQRVPQTVLEPLNWDTLYEVAVLFKILHVAKNSGWVEKKSRLIGTGSDVISHFERDGVNLKIYYQGIPSSFDKVSKYKDLMKLYNLSDRSRRPDIVLEWTMATGKSRYCIIEVKRSQRREYLVDGAYKVFGYLQDYSDIFQSSGPEKAVLVGWSGMNEIKPTEGHDIYLATWITLVPTLSVLLQRELDGKSDEY